MHTVLLNLNEPVAVKPAGNPLVLGPDVPSVATAYASDFDHLLATDGCAELPNGLKEPISERLSCGHVAHLEDVGQAGNLIDLSGFVSPQQARYRVFRHGCAHHVPGF